ncbi:uncharacterized protein LOC131163458 [Malania oleifera]|uniref:uncharacterized protein LOC131163458 n=1 Tax=Malania oleifera TaxID=397392 RepID=UPI0025ADFC33|nr:uncharacterized protein LOC131163458 [Malania oleifera]
MGTDFGKSDATSLFKRLKNLRNRPRGAFWACRVSALGSGSKAGRISFTDPGRGFGTRVTDRVVGHGSGSRVALRVGSRQSGEEDACRRVSPSPESCRRMGRMVLTWEARGGSPGVRLRRGFHRWNRLELNCTMGKKLEEDWLRCTNHICVRLFLVLLSRTCRVLVEDAEKTNLCLYCRRVGPAGELEVDRRTEVKRHLVGKLGMRGEQAKGKNHSINIYIHTPTYTYMLPADAQIRDEEEEEEEEEGEEKSKQEEINPLLVHTSNIPFLLDDGYCWQCYEKSENLRGKGCSYYRCSFLPKCRAKKRLIHLLNERTLIIYQGEHNHPNGSSTDATQEDNSLDDGEVSDDEKAETKPQHAVGDAFDGESAELKQQATIGSQKSMTLFNLFVTLSSNLRFR